MIVKKVILRCPKIKKLLGENITGDITVILEDDPVMTITFYNDSGAAIRSINVSKNFNSPPLNVEKREWVNRIKFTLLFYVFVKGFGSNKTSAFIYNCVVLNLKMSSVHKNYIQNFKTTMDNVSDVNKITIGVDVWNIHTMIVRRSATMLENVIINLLELFYIVTALDSDLDYEKFKERVILIDMEHVGVVN